MVATLRRSLGLVDLVAYGVSVILGAGIYVLVGQAVGLADGGVWISFLIAATIAAFTALSYAELSSTFSQNASEHFYVSKAFHQPRFAFLTGWLILVMGVLSTATIALGFGHYVEAVAPIPATVAAVGIIALFSVLSFWGIQESSKLNIALGLLEVGGLLLVIFLGLPHMGSVDFFGTISWPGIWSAAALIFFAYMGFEGIVKLAEETKNPHQNLPKALLLSLGITTVIYLALSVSLLGLLTPEQLSQNATPLITVVEQELGAGWVMGFIGLFSIAGGVLVMLIVTSRMMYGMAKHGALPSYLAGIHEGRKTPHRAILVTGIFSGGLVFMGNIDFIANAANFATFVVFAIVNACVVRLSLSPHWNPPFKQPLRVGKIPLLAVAGVVSSLGLLLVLPWDVLALGIGFSIAGLVVHELFSKHRFEPKLGWPI